MAMPGYELFNPLKRYNAAMKGGETEKKKTPWLQQDGALGMDRQTLLMGGLGLLTGDKRSGPGYMLQSLSQGIANKQARTKEAEQQAKMDKFAQGLTPEQAALFGIAPQAVAGGMAQQMFAKPERHKPMVVDGRVLDPNDPTKVLADYSQKPSSFETLTPEQETEIFGQDMPGSYQRNSATQEVKPITGTAPKSPLVNVTNNPNQLPSKDTLSPLQLKMDEKYADLLVGWNTGGQGDMVKQSQQLNQVLDVLESGQDVTGFVLGSMPEWMLAGLNPQAMDTKELVQEVVQRSLRETLGAQFTEKEGAMLLARAYNPRLDEKQNAKRVRRLMGMVNSRAEQLNSLNEYMQRTGTSAGWDGTLKSANSILSELDGLERGRTQKRKRWNATTGQMEDVG